MAVQLDDLVPEFRKAVKTLIAACERRGVEMRPYQTVRTPLEQAKLWRQSRASEEIREKIKDLRSKGAPFLADCIERVGKQHGPHVTNAVPGLSWHQWAEAVDAFWAVDGKAVWDPSKKIGGVNGYQVWAAEAKKLGLDPGGLWKRLKDWPHVQLRVDRSPAERYSLGEIDAEMRKRFG
jgi:peptidoglycan L-alanyl-D-glutamate endopeptidase CwlK